MLKFLSGYAKKMILLAVGLLLILTAACVTWQHFFPGKIKTGENKPLITPSAVQKVEKETVPAKQLQAYNKPKLNKKIALPPRILEDQNKQVTAVGSVRTRTGETEILSVTDTETGETELSQQEKKQLLHAEGILSFYAEQALARTEAAPKTRGGVELDIVRIKKGTVLYFKGEAGIAGKEDKPYGAVYGGVKFEIPLFGGN